MSLETDVQELTQATTDLLVAVNVSKATLDGKVEDAGDFATASLNSANASAASAATATTQATAAGTARTGAEAARDAAVVAQNNAVAVVTGGTATLTPSATKIPLSDAQGKIAKGWLTNTDLVEQTDIGTGPNEIPLNQFLGELAYLDAQNIPTLGINVANAATANVTNLMQVTEISNAVPSLNLDFAKVKQLDPRITFTRASTGTYYDGKTVAKAEENLLLHSQDFENGTWAKAATAVTANSTTAPNGTTTAETMTANGIAALHSVIQTILVTSGQSLTFSAYVKADTNDFVQLATNSTQGNIFANFSLSTATAGTTSAATTSSITSAGNGWLRVTVTFTTTNTLSTEFHICVVSSNSAANRESNSLSTSLFIWGAQLEQRASATAYTPTTTQAVTTYIPVLQTAAAGVPRFEHNPVTGESLGLEIEEQRTNLVLQSDGGVGWAVQGTSTVTSDTGIAPNGTITAFTLTSATDVVVPTGGNNAYKTFTVSPSTAYTISLYVKALTATTVSLNIFDGSTGSSSIQAITLTSGWQRVQVTRTSGASTTTMRLTIGAANGTVLCWGAQAEAGAFPTSYIPTVASQVTRAADSAVMTGANFSSWYRQSEGTFFGDANSLATAGSGGFAGGLFNVAGSGSDRISVFVGASNSPRAESVVSGAVPFGLNNGVALPGVYYKNALSYRVNDFAFVTNGAANPDNDGVVMPGALSLLIGGVFGPGSLNGTIKKLTYYPQRLSNAELVEMTA